MMKQKKKKKEPKKYVSWGDASVFSGPEPNFRKRGVTENKEFGGHCGRLATSASSTGRPLVVVTAGSHRVTAWWSR